MKSKRPITLVLFTAFLCAFLTNCQSDANNPPNSDVGAPTVTAKTESTESKPIVYAADIPDKKYDGYEFKILLRQESIGKFWHRDVWAETENGDTLNDAVYKRNLTVEEKFGIKITPVWKGNDIGSSAQSSIMAADDNFDVVFAPLSTLNTLGKSKLLQNMYEVPHLDLSAPWWDQNSVKDLSVDHKLYYVYGDFTIMDEETTWIIYFNKEIQENLGMENFYELVRSGKWTNSKIYELAKTATYDLDGDITLTKDDMVGYLGEKYNIYIGVIGCDVLFVDKDKNDQLVLPENPDRLYKAVESVLSYMNDTSASLISLRDGLDDFQRLAKFQNGQGLFMLCGMINVGVFRDLVADFGLLPVPKLDEAQDDYYTSVSFVNAPGMGIPVSATDLERTGIIMQTYGAESKNFLIPAYYDIALKRKATRDDESSEMIDIIIEGKRYDIGALLDIGGIFTGLQSMVTEKKSDIASLYDSIKESMKIQISKYNEEY